jgi:hypothetical protein
MFDALFSSSDGISNSTALNDKRNGMSDRLALMENPPKLKEYFSLDKRETDDEKLLLSVQLC